MRLISAGKLTGEATLDGGDELSDIGEFRVLAWDIATGTSTAAASIAPRPSDGVEFRAISVWHPEPSTSTIESSHGSESSG